MSRGSLQESGTRILRGTHFLCIILLMESQIGDLIKKARQTRGWDQAELAARIGATQQSVSRWELGASRPRRNLVRRLADVFEVEVDELLREAGYQESLRTDTAVTRPVRPHVEALPIGELPPDRFEQFIVALATLLYPDCDVHRYGSQGHTQHGIDVIVQRGTDTVATFQAKRHRHFGPTKVRQAVQSVTVDSDRHFLVLTRIASPRARDEIRHHEGWDLWDVEDVSRVVRHKLDRDSAVRLVDTYFPNWRESFLGVREPSPWQTADEFFLPFGRDQLYGHEWELVGRQDELDDLRSFVTGERQLKLLIGRGGIGKTRLIRELISTSADTTCRILARNAEVKPQDFELLPASEHLLIVIDDAHERSDLAGLIAGIGRAQPQAKVLLALRPYGLAPLSEQLRRVGLHESEADPLELSDLSHEEARQLAGQILGPAGNSKLVDRLAALTTDCPLITVLGAQLIKRGRLDPTQLEADEFIRVQILRAYQQAVVGDSMSGDSDARGDVLAAVAALQPVRMGDDTFQTALRNLCHLPLDRVVRHLHGLEDSGVLLRRGQSLRIIPDLLGDIVLSDACIDIRSGVDTGYLARAREATSGEPLKHVFINASRVDWQIRRGRRASESLVAALWDALEDEFRTAPIEGRLLIVELLQKVAYFQPKRALALVRYAIENPTERLDETVELRDIHEFTYEDVLQALPPVLRNISYTLEYLPKCIDLLWRLVQRDSPGAGTRPGQALGVLSDLAGLEVGKPVAYCGAIVDAAERWLADADRAPHHVSPFDVLEPILATEGIEHRARGGHRISFRSFLIDADAVRAVRKRVVDLALREAMSSDERRAVRAVGAIGASLHYPRAMFGGDRDESNEEDWTPIFVETIRRVGEVAADESRDPAVGIAIREALSWHAHHSTTDTKPAARQAISRLPSSIEHELALLLHGGRDQFMVDGAQNWRESEQAQQARMDALAQQITTEAADEEVLDLLDRRFLVRRQVAGHVGGNPAIFVRTLLREAPHLARRICERVGANADSGLADIVGIALGRLAESDPDLALEHARQLLELRSWFVTRQVAHAFGWGRGPRDELAEGEFELLEQFAMHEDTVVRESVVWAARAVSTRQPARAADLLVRIRFADSVEVADEVCSVLGGQGGLSWSSLSETQVGALVEQLRLSPTIDRFHVVTLLSELSQHDPECVVRMLIDRVERAEQEDLSSTAFQALPHRWREGLKVRNHPRFVEVLRHVRDWIADNPSSWRRLYMGAELFSAVAGQFDNSVIDVLDEAIRSGQRAQIKAVGAILREAPRSLVWERSDFVGRVLAAAQQHGEDCLGQVSSGLHAAVVSGVRSRTPGHPADEDIEQREKSSEIAARFPRDSLERRFYQSLRDAAERSMQWELDRDSELFDGRDW